jgi:two-component system sensor histidine kinase CpxA
VRSLFVRIFLSFWLAMMLISLSMALVYIVREPSPWVERGRFLTGQALMLHAMELGELRDADRADDMAAASRAFEARTRLHTRVIDVSGESGTTAPNGDGAELPPEVAAVVEEGLRTGAPAWRESSGVDYVAAPLPSGDDPPAVLLAELRHPSSWWRLLGPGPLGVRLLIVFVVSGLVCFALARQLTKPLGKLRQATRALAEEQLGVRVTPQLGNRGDEIGALGRDFDLMADRVEALLEGQKRLLRDVSHELRSPLARLGVALELARQAEGDEARTHLDRMEREATRLNELIGQMLNVAQLEAQAAERRREPVDLTALVRSIAADADFEARETGSRVALLEARPVMVEGHEEMLRRAIENVVRNAARFTAEETRVEVSVEREKASRGEALAQVIVRDHGPGVPEADLERIFEPFVRVGNARDRRSGGTGIGLAVTRRALHLHGGTAVAANGPGGGLVVTLTLPASD